MSELQTEETLTIDNQDESLESVETGTGETGAELATASGEGHEEINQEAINKAINKKHFQFKEEERKRLKVEEEKKALQDELNSLKAPKEPVIPPIPDAYDDDFQAKVKAREEALLAKAEFDAVKKVEQQQLQQAEELKQAEKQKVLQDMTKSYDARISDLNLDADTVHKAGDVLINYGVTEELATFILQDSDGPLLTQYLAANPLEVDKLKGLTPMQAAIELNSSIREKASGLKPKQSNAPDPVKGLNGLGPGEHVPASIKGAKFE
jgi:hypothetical protein